MLAGSQVKDMAIGLAGSAYVYFATGEYTHMHTSVQLESEANKQSL